MKVVAIDPTKSARLMTKKLKLARTLQSMLPLGIIQMAMLCQMQLFAGMLQLTLHHGKSHALTTPSGRVRTQIDMHQGGEQHHSRCTQLLGHQ